MKKQYLFTIPICAAFGASLAAWSEYKKTFYVRMCEPSGFTEKYLREHPELKYESFSCKSTRNCLIKGMKIIPDGRPKALIVMTHGYNLSIENYLPLAKHFSDSGFMVLMFDGVGVGISEGRGIYGLPQHTLDMKSVLDAVISDDEFKDLPLLLFGHSWGGYAACTVSLLSSYPIKGILTCAAFKKSSSSMIPTIRRRYPYTAAVLISSVETLERILFGSLVSATSYEGLKKADCPARLYHSRDDAVISYEESFAAIRRKLKDHKDISFISMEGRNHNLYLDPENDRKQRALIKELKNTCDEDAKSTLTNALWSLMSETDEALAQEFTEFFDSCLK